MASTSKRLALEPYGLENDGALCFMNAMVQSVLSLEYIMKAIHDYTGDREIVKTFKDSIRSSASGTPDALLSRKLIDLIAKDSTDKFVKELARRGRQNSASEAFIALVDKIGLDGYFTSSYRKKITCSECGHESTTKDNFVMLPLFFLKHDENVTSNKLRTAESELEGYKCGGCGKADTSKEFAKLSVLAPYLVLQFNQYGRKKHYKYPAELYFTTVKYGDIVYKAKAQVEHSGSLGGGHYTAKVMRKGGCYAISDTSVSKIEGMTSSSSVYFVIYEVDES